MGVDTKVAGYPVHRVVSFSASITQNGVTIRRIDWISHKASLCGAPCWPSSRMSKSSSAVPLSGRMRRD